MPWFDHPSYRPLRDELIARFKSRAIAFKALRHVIFLCGGNKSERRDFLFNYLRKWTPDALVFQADDVWARIAATPHLSVNALAMEEHLAALADAVLIIVESPGTFAEFGAFSISEPLRKKLLPILDADYAHSESFINSGPVRWVDADSLFTPSLFVNLDSILTAVDEINSRLARLPAPSTQRVDSLIEHPKHLLFFIRDILAVIGPIRADHLERYLKEILGASPPHLISLLGLAQSLGLLESGVVGSAQYYFARITDDFKPVVRKKFFELPRERAKVMAVLQTIDAAREPLRLLSR